MRWFRAGSAIFMLVVFIWSVGISWAVIDMFAYGAATKGILDDPTKNGTAFIYFLLAGNEIYLCICCLFGFFVAFRMWRNNFQIDHQLRHLFIIWLGMWGAGTVLCLICAIYMIIRATGSQEYMAVLFDTFTRYGQDQKFVSTMEKFQRETQCCGIYGPDDWLMLQLRQLPAGAGGVGGGGGGFQSLDYGFRQNPSTGKCHLLPPTIPAGCGLKILEEINFRLKIYAALCMVEIVLCAITGALCWYCFFYWLEKEVIVIPEDEVSNVIIIEPESDTTVELSPGSPYLSPTAYYSGSRALRRASYMQQRSYYDSRISQRDSFNSRSRLRMAQYMSSRERELQYGPSRSRARGSQWNSREFSSRNRSLERYEGSRNDGYSRSRHGHDDRESRHHQSHHRDQGSLHDMHPSYHGSSYRRSQQHYSRSHSSH